MIDCCKKILMNEFNDKRFIIHAIVIIQKLSNT